MATPFCSPATLATGGLPLAALGATTAQQQQAACDAANGMLDAVARGRYGEGAMPPATWGPEWTQWGNQLARWQLLTVRGCNPLQPSDVTVRLGFEDAKRDLAAVQRQALHPDITFGAAAPTFANPLVISSSSDGVMSGCRAPTRGW